MRSFWSFARRMLRYRWLLVLTLVLAAVSAGSLGGGLVAVAPVVEKIMGKVQRGLPELAREFNERAPWVRIPEPVIERLPHGPFTAACWIMGGLAVLTVIGGAATFLHSYFSLTIVNRTIANIRREAFHRVLRLPLKDVIVGGTSDTISRLVNDTAALSAGMNALLSKAVSQASKGIAALVVAFWWDWRLAVGASLLGPVLGVIIRKLGKRIRRASASALTSQAGLLAAASEALQGFRVVKVHTTERYEAGRFHRLNKLNMRELNRVRTARALATPLVEVLSIFVVGALALVAIKAIRDGIIEPERVFLTLMSLGIAGASLRPLTGIVNDIQASAGAAERLEELLATAPEPGWGADLPDLPRHAASVEVRAVTLTYPRSSRPALDGVSLSVRRGERVAVVGPNGSGKTTLLGLVPRLFDPDPGRGVVLIDGRDLRLFSVRSLRRQVGVVTQETVLFRGTVSSNIAYGATGVTRERIEDAARRARAHDFITRLPQGYETPVGEQGLTLSGGQRQRIAIARAILRDPSILILDEATSMIDAESEAQIGAAIGEFSRGRTCLLVAHRLSTVVSADRIVVMDQGRIVDQGTHAELLDRCETYRLIARQQLIPGRAPDADAMTGGEA